MDVHDPRHHKVIFLVEHAFMTTGAMLLEKIPTGYVVRVVRRWFTWTHSNSQVGRRSVWAARRSFGSLVVGVFMGEMLGCLLGPAFISVWLAYRYMDRLVMVFKDVRWPSWQGVGLIPRIARVSALAWVCLGLRLLAWPRLLEGCPGLATDFPHRLHKRHAIRWYKSCAFYPKNGWVEWIRILLKVQDKSS